MKIWKERGYSALQAKCISQAQAFAAATNDTANRKAYLRLAQGIVNQTLNCPAFEVKLRRLRETDPNGGANSIHQLTNKILESNQ